MNKDLFYFFIIIQKEMSKINDFSIRIINNMDSINH